MSPEIKFFVRSRLFVVVIIGIVLAIVAGRSHPERAPRPGWRPRHGAVIQPKPFVGDCRPDFGRVVEALRRSGVDPAEVEHVYDLAVFNPNTGACEVVQLNCTRRRPATDPPCPLGMNPAWCEYRPFGQGISL